MISASQFEKSRKTLSFRLFLYLLSVRHVPNCAVSVYVNRAPDGVRRGVFLGHREPFPGIGARVGDTPQKEAGDTPQKEAPELGDRNPETYRRR